MDGLRQHAITLFSKRQRFDLSALSFDIIEIIKHAEGDTTFRHTSAFKDNLLDRVKDIPNYRNEQPRSRLQLVRIPRSQYNVLSIEQQLFSDLFALYRIEKYYLHSAGYETRGFQRFRSYTSGSGPDYIDSFFLDTTSALVLWSFDSSTKTTKVILVPSYATGIPDTTNVFEQFAQHLETHQNLVDTPFLVHLVSAIVIGSWLDIGIITAYQAMRQAEILTEHGVWRSYGRPPPELDELIRSSRDIGFTMTSLMNASRHVDIVRSLLAIDATTEEVAPMCLATKPGQSSDVRASTALKAIQNRVAMRKLDTEYLHERAKTQSSVIFSLITRKHTEASLEIATSTRTDSASMKMLGLMATLFLPGTFFATLFSIPSLRWAEPEIISNRFWIYWAFVVPSTAFLLVVYKGWVPSIR